jgi:hypothetical protein
MDGSRSEPKMTAGLDLGDRYSYLCLIDTDNGVRWSRGVGYVRPPRPSEGASDLARRLRS